MQRPYKSELMQADTDHHVKDTYNYVTVQADIKIPGRHFAYLEDSSRHGAYRKAIEAALQQLEADDKDARVLNLGCGAGKMPCLPKVHRQEVPVGVSCSFT